MLIHWLQLHPHWGGFVTFLISAMESLAIVGTVVPGSVMMAGIGALIGTGILPFWTTLIWAIAGAIAGDGASYMIGRHYKDHIREIWPFKTRPHLLESGKVFFEAHGGTSVFAGRFVGPVRAIIPLIAGMMQMPRYRFFLANISSGLIWAPAYMLPGFILGAISLQLPAHVAIRYIAIFLAFCLGLIILAWALKKLYDIIGDELNKHLTNTRKIWENSKRKYWLAKLLEHPEPAKRNLQLARLIALCFILLIFFTLMAILSVKGVHLSWNEAANSLSRNLRTPYLTDFFIVITYLSDTGVLAVVGAATTLYFVIAKQYRLAAYWVGYCFIVLASILCVKFFIHTPRPEGILVIRHGFSFPSGHTVRWIAMIGFLVTRLIWSLEKHFYKPIIRTFVTITLLIMMSRIYLSAHWLTDVVGGLLLGSALLLTGNLLYERKPEGKFNPKIMLTIVISTLIIGTSAYATLNFSQDKHNSEFKWNKIIVDENTWWEGKSMALPTHLTSALGMTGKLLNIQWAGSLNNIAHTLNNAGWERTAHIDWKQLLHPVALIQAMQSSPFLQRKYEGQIPALVFAKPDSHNSTMIIYLWDSHIELSPNQQKLWIGRVDYLRKHYNQQTEIVINGRLQHLKNELGNHSHKTIHGHHSYDSTKSILLVKPQG